jgi:guanine deaminase
MITSAIVIKASIALRNCAHRILMRIWCAYPTPNPRSIERCANPRVAHFGERALRFARGAGKLKCMSDNAANPELMKRAIAIAMENVRNGGGPFGTVIARDTSIVAEGVNRVTATNDPTAHAEIVAIRTACAKLAAFQLDGCDLYTTCEPCPMCLGAIYWARPARVFYASSAGDAAAAGFDDKFIYDELYLPFAAREIPMTQLMREESLLIFTAWKKSENKTEY